MSRNPGPTYPARRMAKKSQTTEKGIDDWLKHRKNKHRAKFNASGEYRDEGGASSSSCSAQQDASESSSDPRSHSKRKKAPPGLRGKEIGLWHAAQNKLNGPNGKGRSNKERATRPVVGMQSHTMRKLENLLDRFHHATGSTEKLTDDSNQFNMRYKWHMDESEKRSSGVTEQYDPEIHGLQGKPALDQQLMDEQQAKLKKPVYLNMLKFRQKLPSYKMRQEILDVIEQNQVTVISGETGCGKTTQVPQFILDSYVEKGKGSICSIVCTQPRRISAISVAERVAQERSEVCGGANSSAGFQIRLESKLPRKQGSILFCTTGIMLKWLESDQFLANISHIILDEVHERDCLSDFLLIILKDLLVRRPDLKLILMSATINAEQFANYYGKSPMLTIPGFTFPVKQIFLEDILKTIGYQIPESDESRKKKNKKNRKNDEKGQLREDEKQQMEPFFRKLHGRYPSHVIQSLRNYEDAPMDYELVVAVIRHICQSQDPGAILVFLPGWEDISKVNGLLSDERYFQSNRFLIIPLHSQMPTVNQRTIFDHPPDGVRKIILSTNIAETSITIDDVVYVVDGGKMKIKMFDVENNIATLKPEWISRANASQRKGRAGRVQEGICYHLYSTLRSEMLDSYLLPEMLRTRLEELCLQIKILKLGKIIPFLSKALEAPPLNAVNLSIEFLKTLNALDDDENLTPLGFHLAHLPVDPQAGKMILFGAMFSCLDPITTVAASLSYKDAFYVPLGREAEAQERRMAIAHGSMSDHILLINAFKGWKRAKQYYQERQYCWDNFLSANTLKLLDNMKTQLCGYLKDLGLVRTSNCMDPEVNINSRNEKLVKAIVCAGLYPNVAKVLNHTRKVKNANNYRHELCSVLTKDDMRATIHPKSVNCHVANFESPWMVYHQKMKSTQVFLYDTTVTIVFPLLLFGGKLGLEKEGDHTALVVDQWIRFWCPRTTAELVMELRRELDKLLEYKINHPGPTVWTEKSTEGALLLAIVELLESEEVYTCPAKYANDYRVT